MEINKQKMTEGFFWSYGERILAQLVSLIVSVILARLLEPENYGIISIVMIFITLCDAVVTGGFGNSIVQKKDADELDVNTMLICSVIVSAILYIIIFFAAPCIAVFYEIDVICPILRVLGLRLLISGVNSIQKAWIQKRMLFKNFFVATSLGTIISAIIGIFMACAGFGVWSLVIQYLMNNFIDTIVLLLTNDWKPQIQFSWIRAKSMLSYGWKVLLMTVVYTIEGDLRSLIIGKRFGSAELAFYDQGKKFPNLLVTNINSSISSVMFPVLSQNQNDIAKLKQICRRSVKTGTFLLSPLLIGLVAVADTFVVVVFSDKWISCIPYIRILTFVFLVRPFTTVCQQSILSVGKSNVTLRIELAINMIAIGILFFAVFVMESVLWIAIGSLITEVVSMIFFMFYENKIIHYTYLEQLEDILPGILQSVMMGGIVYLLRFLPFTKTGVLILQIICGVLFYLFVSYLLQNGSFVYLAKMFQERSHNNKITKLITVMIREKRR